jgi:hypothetical protein
MTGPVDMQLPGLSPGAGGQMLEVRDLHVEIAARHGIVRAVDGV